MYLVMNLITWAQTTVQCNARNLRAVWSSREISLNPDQGSRSNESGFSARVESPKDNTAIAHLTRKSHTLYAYGVSLTRNYDLAQIWLSTLYINSSVNHFNPYT